MVKKLSLGAAATAFASVSHAWLPDGKIRGVDLGSMFVFEPWIDGGEWSNIGCGDDQKSEFDCVSYLGQDDADSAFQKHWDNWITSDDLDQMKGYGLNTIRIPLGYWLKEDLVDSSEHFPKGGLDKLTKFVGEATDKGFYIILGLHGAPGAQRPKQPFTGQYVSDDDFNNGFNFYNEYNYGRAIEWLKWITETVQTKNEFDGVGMIEILNEPLQDNDHEDLRSSYYVDALNAIRDTESEKGVESDKAVHVQMMGSNWGSGDPTEFLPDTTNTAYDDHRYLKYDPDVDTSQDAYLSTSCNDDRSSDGEDTLIIGEWSLSPSSDVENNDDWSPDNASDFYKKWFAAQIQSYERSTNGWVFWTWKAGLGDPRWSYKDAVDAGIIPSNIEDALNANVC